MGKLTCCARMSRILRRLWMPGCPGPPPHQATPTFTRVLTRELISSFLHFFTFLYILLVLQSASVCFSYVQFLPSEECALINVFIFLFVCLFIFLLHSTPVSAPGAHGNKSTWGRNMCARFEGPSVNCQPGLLSLHRIILTPNSLQYFTNVKMT